ncbi:MAG TPA: hypothetical protein VFR87_07395 [Nocardioidaceae bacterium]|nr:hypothetical protein [Nocardioidaceae bacterium]
MSPSRNTRVRRTAAVVALLVLPLAGCSESEAEKAVNDATGFMSNAETCTELVRITARHLAELRDKMDQPAEAERTLRQAADELRAEAEQVDDAELEQAINDYVAKVRRVSERAADGRPIDLDVIQEANGALAAACT